jgi:hypothetical protein
MNCRDPEISWAASSIRALPYRCEFCDIGLYGRNPRLKTPQQIIAELDKLANAE